MSEEPSIRFGPFVFDPNSMELSKDGAIVPLGGRGAALLKELLGARGGLVSKEALLAAVWPGTIVEESNIAVQIATLRKALGLQQSGKDWIVTVPRTGYRLVREVGIAPYAIHMDDERPALAVLPFVNLSGTGAQDYLGDGIVEDLISAFSRFRSFAVVSRQSSFAYKETATDVRDVAAALGVRYVLEGSIRMSGERIRVTTQLVDAKVGTHLWAESFDGELHDIFEFQDAITASVVGLVEPQIRRAEIERARRRPPNDVKAYDLFLRALPHFYSNNPAGYLAALADLERAVALQPDYSIALAYASWALMRRVTVSLKALHPHEEAKALEFALAALRHGEGDPVVLAVCGHSLICAGLRQEGLASVRLGLTANPHNVLVQAQGGTCNMLVGDLAEAEACYMRVHRLSPGVPEAYEALAGVGATRFFDADYADALHWLDRSRVSLREWPPVYWLTIASYAQLGRIEEARATLARLFTFAPQTSLAGIRLIAARSDGRWDAVIAGLSKAGLS